MRFSRPISSTTRSETRPRATSSQRVLGMECMLGKDYPTDQLREAIVAKIIRANLVFADLACITDDASKTLRPNLNTCIEAGIAMGAQRPVFVTALDPASCNPEVQR